jgi:diaminohydroxyphosphoribosylaminopyrimidine deaminase/5-amino-6-(5-phosphoribosylamino)uracil reductase
LFDNTQKTLCYNAFSNEEKGNSTFVQIDFDENFLANFLRDLYQRKIQSILVEGGAILLQAFLNEELFDEIRVFKSPTAIKKGTAAPLLPTGIQLVNQVKVGEDWLSLFD